MNILIIAEDTRAAEAQKKFGSEHRYMVAEDRQVALQHLAACDVVFDFSIETNREWINHYTNHAKPVFLNTTNVTLNELSRNVRHTMKAVFYGFNGLPTLLDRSILEVSLLEKKDRAQLEAICNKLGTRYLEVEDRVGMVTPRVIAMIINEAYFTVQEGTASREDIDIAMKLGTNYPFGPFEWCRRIGIANIYALLSAIYNDTFDERYKICPLLKQEFLKS